MVGKEVVGNSLGILDGCRDADAVDTPLGAALGRYDGQCVGDEEGYPLGHPEDSSIFVGKVVGMTVGSAVEGDKLGIFDG